MKRLKRTVVGIIALVLITLTSTACTPDAPWLVDHPDIPGYCHGGCPS